MKIYNNCQYSICVSKLSRIYSIKIQFLYLASMKILLEHATKTYKADLSKPLDISIPMFASEKSVRAWYVDPLRIEPVVMGNWVAAVNSGASVNFNNIFFNPHGHGTHTECYGHISKEVLSINQALKQFAFTAKVCTIVPEIIENGDGVIQLESLKESLGIEIPKAVIIRTSPNDIEKLIKNYSNTNPTYLDVKAAIWLREQGVEQLLIDTPSVDREEDGGALLSHKAFWNYPENPRANACITELIFVPNAIKDGLYLLHLSFASFENDAAPSKPVLYALE
jgi:arylformamidase